MRPIEWLANQIGGDATFVRFGGSFTDQDHTRTTSYLCIRDDENREGIRKFPVSDATIIERGLTSLEDGDPVKILPLFGPFRARH